MKDPFAAPIKPAPSSGTYVESLIKPAPAANPNPSLAPRQLPAYEEKPDINRDIQVTKELGPWMIMVHAYATAEAAVMARQMVSELRAGYKLPAYTFNYGAEERRKEHERVRSLIEKQREYLTRNGLPADQIRVRTMRIEEQVGVLIGGYPSDEAARRALDGIRKLKPLDPAKVMLDKRVFFNEEKSKDYHYKAEKVQEGFVNPFLGAFVVHNPTTKMERPADWDKLDIGYLHKLNAGESFSLLNCKKQYTLAVKQFQTPAILETKSTAAAFLDKLTSGGKSERVDAAATSAHNLAELLRKAKLDAYVLHTKYTSFVCVGGYDNLDDPALRNMASLLETKVMPQMAPYFPAMPNQGVAQAKVMPMQIPR